MIIFLFSLLFFLKFVVYIATTGVIHISTHYSLYASKIKSHKCCICMENEQFALILEIIWSAS